MASRGAKGGSRDGWRRARLIPTIGSRNEKEREKRATSCLLAVMHGVPEFGHALLKDLGAPRSPVIETFAEVRFKDGAGKTTIPDGAVVCRRGKATWTCLVEVKTGSDRLKADQVSGYLDLARENDVDAVLTISPQITASSSESPVLVDKRKLRRTSLFHLSWWRVLTEAVVQQRYRGISDPDQEWVLSELIHYLSSEASGALGFEDMGEDWPCERRVETAPCAWATQVPEESRSAGTNSRQLWRSASRKSWVPTCSHTGHEGRAPQRDSRRPSGIWSSEASSAARCASPTRSGRSPCERTCDRSRS